MPVTSIINNEIVDRINAINLIPAHIINEIYANPDQAVRDGLVHEYMERPKIDLINAFIGNLPTRETRVLTHQQLFRYAQQIIERISFDRVNLVEDDFLDVVRFMINQFTEPANGIAPVANYEVDDDGGTSDYDSAEGSGILYAESAMLDKVYRDYLAIHNMLLGKMYSSTSR